MMTSHLPRVRGTTHDPRKRGLRYLSPSWSLAVEAINRLRLATGLARFYVATGCSPQPLIFRFLRCSMGQYNARQLRQQAAQANRETRLSTWAEARQLAAGSMPDQPFWSESRLRLVP